MTEKKIYCTRMISLRGWPQRCSRTAKVTVEGRAYCSIHDPVKEREKAKEQNRKFAIQSERRSIERERQQLAADCLAAVLMQKDSNYEPILKRNADIESRAKRLDAEP
jgi:hypothetical protein